MPEALFDPAADAATMLKKYGIPATMPPAMTRPFRGCSSTW
jgi:hypothetical protein